jgi:hypothetical protein
MINLRFWYHVFTCVSDRLRRAASSIRSCTLRYFCRSKLFSKQFNCWSVNAVRALRGFLFDFNVLPFIIWPPPLSDVLVSSPISESIEKIKTFSWTRIKQNDLWYSDWLKNSHLVEKEVLKKKMSGCNISDLIYYWLSLRRKRRYEARKEQDYDLNDHLQHLSLLVIIHFLLHRIISWSFIVQFLDKSIRT